MRCVLETFPYHMVYHPLGFPCMFQLQEDSLEPGDLEPMEWVPRSITLKRLHLLTQPHQSSQPQGCPALCLIQLWVQMWSIQVASQPLTEFCKNFSLFPCVCFFFFFVVYFYNGVQLLFTSVFMLLSTHWIHLQSNINKYFLRFFLLNIFFSSEQGVLSSVH